MICNKLYTHLLLLFLLTAWQPLMAQRPPMKWGDVPLEDLQMTTYMADSNASAVILGEYGEVEVYKDGVVEFDYHLRVKLLTEAAYDDWGTYTLPFWTGDYPQRISQVQAQTFVLNDGQPERHKLGKKSIFKENITGDWDQMKFTLPALEPGAVVEYRYTMTSESPIYLPNWTFQHSEPTRWSEYRVQIPNRYSYVQVASNTLFTIIESEPLRGPDGDGMLHRWAMNDVPALRDEPFITTLEDYRAKIEFQLSSYFTITGGWIQYLNTWDKLAEELRGLNSFGKALKATRQVRSKTESVIEGSANDHEKLHAIDQYVRQQVVWNEEFGFTTDKGLNDVLKSGTGSSADQTLLLIAMLKAAGLEAYPVLISTRGHGAVQKAYPIINQFNYIIAYANVDGKEYLIDPTEPLASVDMLPLRALNGQGWLVMENSAQWIPIDTGDKYFHLLTVEGQLGPDGTLTGHVQSASKGYGAFTLRNELAEEDERTVVENEVLDGLDEIEFRDTRVNNLDELDKTLELETDVTIRNFAQSAGDFLYAASHALGGLEENPLKLSQRTFPVDLGYPRDYVYTFRFTLPEGYVVQDKPADVTLRLPGKGGSFQRTTTVMGNVMIIQSRFVLTQSKYEPHSYAGLKELYDRVVASQAEQIVLKRVGS